MKKTLYIFSVAMLIALMAFNGCKKDGDPVSVADTTIPDDIFPLKATNRFVYSGYFTNADTETPIAGTDALYSTSWTLGSSATPFSAIFGATYGGLVSANNGGRTSASLIYDTTLIVPPLTPAGVTVKKFTPIFAYYDTVNADYYYMTNLGLFFRGSVIRDSANGGIRRDSLRFIKLASPRAKIGGEFTSFQQSYISYSNPLAPTTIVLTVTGKWESKVDVTVNDTTYSSYYLIISRTAKVGTATVASGVTAKLWLVKGVGPVKMFLAGDAEAPGNYRVLKSKKIN
ncbi:MAG: hypothetical protein Q8L88_03030 [Bacteroidota bacterium]|nr:hypothetical protein [Bacteroidota bacterium]